MSRGVQSDLPKLLHAEALIVPATTIKPNKIVNSADFCMVFSLSIRLAHSVRDALQKEELG